MYLVGLTGGIASGKSVVSTRLAEHGAIVVDADKLAREVVEPGSEGLAAIEAAFGSGVIAADGSLDRPALGAIVFGHPDRLEVLNGITHPAVWRLARRRFAEAPDDAVVVYDVPLLVEGNAARQIDFDHILVVEAEPEVRVERMVGLRGMSRADAESRIASQASNAERSAAADTVIDSNGTLDDTIRQVDEFWMAISGR